MCPSNKASAKSVTKEVNIGTHWFSIHGATVGWTTLSIAILALITFLVFLAIWACIRRCSACRDCADCVPCGCLPKSPHDDRNELELYSPPTPGSAPLPMAMYHHHRAAGLAPPLRPPPVTRTFIRNKRDPLLPPYFPGHPVDFTYAPERFQDVDSTPRPRTLEGPSSDMGDNAKPASQPQRRPRRNSVTDLIEGPPSTENSTPSNLGAPNFWVFHLFETASNWGAWRIRIINYYVLVYVFVIMLTLDAPRSALSS